MWISNFTSGNISKGNENCNSKRYLGNTLTVQWLGLHTFTAGVLGSIPGQETRIPQALQCGKKKKKKNLHSQAHNRVIHNSKDKETTLGSMMDKWIRELWCTALWHTHILSLCVCVYKYIQSSVHFSHSVMSNCLGTHGLQHARLSCRSPTTGLAKTHVHWLSDAIQSSHPMLSPCHPAFNLS